jgi:hypothetical protein
LYYIDILHFRDVVCVDALLNLDALLVAVQHKHY